MLYLNARILRDGGFFAGDLRTEGERIVSVGRLRAQEGEPTVDLGGRMLVPGLIETHFHGAMGFDSSMARTECFAAFSDFMAKNGITTFIPALISSPDDVIERYFAAGNDYMRQTPTGAQMAGFYLEGPFLSPQYKGAHDPAALQFPSADKLRRWLDMANGKLRKVLIAPELPGALDAIRAAVENGAVAEIGHSAATYGEAMAGIDAGATRATHVFNAMPPLHHREPGLLGAVLTDDRVTCELIADFGHVAPSVVKLVCLAKGVKRVDLISDSCTAAGLGDVDYVHTDGRTIRVRDGLARLENGTLMGSASTVLDGVRHVASLGFTVADALGMATRNPAHSLGLTDRGEITVGRRADLTVLEEDLTVCRTVVGGKTVFERSDFV